MSTGQQTTPSSSQVDDRHNGKRTDDDYPLRYAPSHYRRWSPATVAITALGGIAYLADFSIGASIALSYGTWNAILGILVAGPVPPPTKVVTPAARASSTC
ncbi:hypothetical protein [Bombella favorum]|uniref:hypothetical protein n=1 Tax=Bombella favorum TaxID=2039164 RepID=UPI001E45E413|nr:hypothetical protein [Bombella favorum]